MRRLPRKRSKRQTQIIQATEEWFGTMNPQEKKSSVKISLWLMGRRRGITLTEEEKEITWMVQKNMQAEVGI